MELTSRFSLNGADSIDGEPISPANWINAFVNLSFDKDSVIAKSKGVVSTTEWEFIAKSATFLKDWQKDGLTGGLGVLQGVPFKWELLDDGASVEVYDGYLNLSKATFECDRVTASATLRKQIDDLNSKVDSFTYEYLLSIGKLTSADYVHVPYSKLPVQNQALEVITSIIQLVLLIIQLQQAITELVKLIIGLATFTWADLFKAIIQTAYTFALTVATAEAIDNLLKSIIQPVKFHAGMTELRLMQVGAEHLGYDFASNILEEDYPTAAIIPEKWSITTNENDDLITGFTTIQQALSLVDYPATNHAQQNGYFNGTFGDVIRILKTKYNAKIVIEESTTGGNQIMRLEREDYIGDINSLYEIPAIDNNDTFRLNSDEFNANYLIEYQLDSANKATYLSYGGTIYQSTITPATVDPNNPDLSLMTGIDTRSIALAKGTRKNSITVVEKVATPLLNIIGTLILTITVSVNYGLILAWNTGYSMIIDINSIISAVNGLPGLGLNIPLINVNALGTLEELPLVVPPDYSPYFGDRIGMLQVENDFLNVPHNVLLDIEGQVENDDPSFFSQILDEAIPYIELLTGQTISGNPIGNRLVANHSREIGAKTLWEKYHSINSFVPNTEGDPDDTSNPKHNQWKLYEFENVPFCYEDYIKVKNNNNITFVGKVGRVESLEWDIYNQKANISFRVNELWTANLKLTSNEPIGR